ncbi:MAG: hypothetical protein HFG51_01730 [Lachnospiraceae bacterium]|nr:hypothetical protein [Lachnospiraceae bacterium]
MSTENPGSAKEKKEKNWKKRFFFDYFLSDSSQKNNDFMGKMFMENTGVGLVKLPKTDVNYNFGMVIVYK